MRSVRSLRRIIVAFAAASAVAVPVLAQDPDRPKVTYNPIALSGQPAPGFGGQSFSEFPYHSYTGESNHVVFLASVNAPYRHAQPNGIFLNHDAQTSLVAKAGQPAPGFAPDVIIQSFDINFHKANRFGQVVFESTLAGPGIDNTGDDNTNAFANWIYSDGQLTKIAQFREPAAGIPGAIYRTFSRTTINDQGNVAFAGDLVNGNGINPGNDGVFWYGNPSNLQVLAREGDPLPGRGASYFELTGFNYPVLSSNGYVAFGARTGPFIHDAFIVGTPGNLTTVAMTDDPAPGTSTTFRNSTTGFTHIDVNNFGVMSFGAVLNDGTYALYVGGRGQGSGQGQGDSQLRKIARTSEPAPGLPGRNYDFFFGGDLNDRGEVAFLADTQATDDTHFAVFLAKPNNETDLIAANGQPAPGAGPGVTFGNFFSYPVINRDGQVAFFASLVGPNSRGNGEEDYGVFATGHDGDLRLVARFGDVFDIAPGDERMIASLSDHGLYGIHELNFSDEFTLSFKMRFTDGSEALVTARVLPEPTLLVPIAAMLPLLMSRGRRGRRGYHAQARLGVRSIS
jgi:hypothetical protein